MNVSCPSLPPKILVADKVRPNETTYPYLAARGCHFVVCFRSVLLINIEVLFLTRRDWSIARIVLYKVSVAIVSRSFPERSTQLRYSHRCYGLPVCQLLNRTSLPLLLIVNPSAAAPPVT